MFRAIIGWLAILASVTLAHAVSGPQPITQYETPAEERWAPFSSDLPKCDDASVLSTITGRFSQTENTYWGGDNAIAGIDRVRDIGFRANGLSYIPRRYCIALATVVDPRVPPPLISEDPYGHLRRCPGGRDHRLELGRRVVRRRLRSRITLIRRIARFSGRSSSAGSARPGRSSTG